MARGTSQTPCAALQAPVLDGAEIPPSVNGMFLPVSGLIYLTAPHRSNHYRQDV